MDLKIDIDPAKIEAEVVKAIAASAFGDRLAKAVEAALASLGTSRTWNNELENWVKAEMHAIVRKQIETVYADTIRARILASLTPEVIAAMVTKVTERIMQQRVSEF